MMVSAIVYPLMMGGILFFSWYYIQPLLQYYQTYNGMIEEEEPVILIEEDPSPFVDFHRNIDVFTF